MKDDLTELLQHANKATRGDWHAVGFLVENGNERYPDICSINGWTSGHMSGNDNPNTCDIEYIAAAQPKVIKALIREIRALRKQVTNG